MADLYWPRSAWVLERGEDASRHLRTPWKAIYSSRSDIRRQREERFTLRWLQDALTQQFSHTYTRVMATLTHLLACEGSSGSLERRRCPLSNPPAAERAVHGKLAADRTPWRTWTWRGPCTRIILVPGPKFKIARAPPFFFFFFFGEFFQNFKISNKIWPAHSRKARLHRCFLSSFWTGHLELGKFWYFDFGPRLERDLIDCVLVGHVWCTYSCPVCLTLSGQTV